MTDDRDQVIVTESGQTTVTIDNGVETRQVVVDSETVSVVTAATQGPTGPAGSGDKHYEQAFATAASVTVTHNLAKFPAVTIMDSAHDEVEGVVNHVTPNQLIVTFSAPFSGTVFCN